MFDLLKNLSADKIFTPTGQPLSEAFGIRPDATIAEIAKPDLKFADIAVPFTPGLDVSIRPGLIDPGRIDPGDVRKPPVDPTTPALSWPSVGIPADVRPGDLIQAAAWNALLAWVRALYANAGKAAPAQPAAPTTPTAPGGGIGTHPLPIDPGTITPLQPIPLPTIPHFPFPVERPPIETLLGHPEIMKTIIANPSILDMIVKSPQIGETLVAHPEILTSIVSTPVSQPVFIQP